MTIPKSPPPGLGWLVGGSRSTRSGLTGQGGCCDVVTSLAGRSARTARLAEDAGLRLAPGPVDVLGEADVILVVTPPGAAIDAAAEIATMAAAPSVAERLARVGRGTARPLVVDLNAISPTTANTAADVITAAGFHFVDGSISGPPPSRSSARRSPAGATTC